MDPGSGGSSPRIAARGTHAVARAKASPSRRRPDRRGRRSRLGRAGALGVGHLAHMPVQDGIGHPGQTDRDGVHPPLPQDPIQELRLVTVVAWPSVSTARWPGPWPLALELLARLGAGGETHPGGLGDSLPCPWARMAYHGRPVVHPLIGDHFTVVEHVPTTSRATPVEAAQGVAETVSTPSATSRVSWPRPSARGRSATGALDRTRRPRIVGAGASRHGVCGPDVDRHDLAVRRPTELAEVLADGVERQCPLAEERPAAVAPVPNAHARRPGATASIVAISDAMATTWRRPGTGAGRYPSHPVGPRGDRARDAQISR